MLGVNMVRFWSVPAVLAAVLGGCTAGSPSAISFSKAPEAPLVPVAYPEKYQMQIADLMRTYLHNPTKVKDAFIGEPVVRPVGGTSLYVTCVRYNPRDLKEPVRGRSNQSRGFPGRQAQPVPSGRSGTVQRLGLYALSGN